MHWIQRCAAFILLPSLALSLAACGGDAANNDLDRHVEGATEIVLLGTTHFAGSALDKRSSEVPGLLSPARQQELDAVADRIADWAPIGSSWSACRARRARSIRCTRPTAPATTTRPRPAIGMRFFQLGFRAADRAELERTGCVDAAGLWLGAQAQQVAKTHNPAVLDSLRRHGEAMMNDAAFLQDR
ncbi:MAG: hypothetical protein GVY12_15735, partial [Bacteroidetes bacterium]|nr:hypothetical protein [Bacteroidota bacterium]